MARKRVSDAPVPVKPIRGFSQASSAPANEPAPGKRPTFSPPDQNLVSYFSETERECIAEIKRWREPGTEDRWPIERERVRRLLAEAKRLADKIAIGEFDPSYCARVQARLQMLTDDWTMVCRMRARAQSKARPYKSAHSKVWTNPAAKHFVSDYIAKQERTGQTPTQHGMLTAARLENKRGGRDLLRRTFNEQMRRLGKHIRPGRPTKLAREIRGN